MNPLLHVVLYQPEIPQNTGNIGRTCVAAGAKLWLVRPLGFRMDDRHVRRAGLDYWEHLDWEAVDDWAGLRQRIPTGTAWLFTKKSHQSYTGVRYAPGDLLVFGSETQGLPDGLLQQHADTTLGIAMRPPVRSLNLANAVAIGVYEALRQIGPPVDALRPPD